MDSESPIQTKSKPKIHKDMEYKLMDLYEDKNLTVVSEEPSKFFTELNFGQKNNEMLNGTIENSGFKISMPSGKHVLIENINEIIKNKQKINKNRRISVQLPKNNHLNILRKLFKIKSSASNKLSESSDIKNKSIFSGKDSTKIQSIADSVYSRRSFFPSPALNQNNSKMNNNLLIQDSILEKNNELIAGSYNSLHRLNTISCKEVNQQNFDQLFDVPSEPSYQINLLQNVCSNKKIQKKEIFVENIFFKISCGLYYEGMLKFGKMHGQGKLYLEDVISSSSNSDLKDKHTLYQGGFFDNKIEGVGKLFFKGGSYFEGSFKNGLAHGNGKLFIKDGDQIEGVWLEGNYFS
jgi:hypothetical protein